MQEYLTPKVSFIDFWFLFAYCWMAALTVLFVGWCYYNQKIDPVGESEADLLPVAGDSSEAKENVRWVQIGYKFHWIGFMICVLVWITLWMFQFLLVFFTICYYMAATAIKRWPLVFHDDMQALEAFM
jgi:hypothetical protein